MLHFSFFSVEKGGGKRKTLSNTRSYKTEDAPLFARRFIINACFFFTNKNNLGASMLSSCRGEEELLQKDSGTVESSGYFRPSQTRLCFLCFILKSLWLRWVVIALKYRHKHPYREADIVKLLIDIDAYIRGGNHLHSQSVVRGLSCRLL